eukprot:9502009-Pyramimonas_sp.AAC.1
MIWASWPLLGMLWESSWAVLGSSGPSGDVLGASWNRLGSFWHPLGLSGPPLGSETGGGQRISADGCGVGWPRPGG